MPPQYSQNIEKLIWNESFRKWVLQPTPESDAFWHVWQVSNPDRIEDVRLARTVVSSLHVRERHLPDLELQQLISQTLVRAQLEPSASTVERAFRWQPLAWAALLALASGLGWYFWQQNRSFQEPLTYQGLTQTAPVSLVEKVNESAREIRLRLPDGSQIGLKPQARVSFPAVFAATKREIFLTGEATFAVSSDPKRPFFVYSDEVVTKVLGTRFTVRSVQDEKEVKVTVQSGKVSVFARQRANQDFEKTGNGVVLSPNQQVIFSRKDVRFRKTLVQQPVAIQAIRPGQNFVYDETPISEVFSQLETTYGIRIDFDKTALKPCTITATLEEGGLFDKLGAVCRAIGASYTVLDGQIVVSSSGCG